MIYNKNDTFKKTLFYFICLMAFIAMCQNFRKNSFGIVDGRWFEYWQEDSEWLVRQRIIDDDKFGFGYNYGLLGEWSDTNYEPRVYNEDHGVYTAQIGLQGMAFGLIYKISHSLSACYWVNVILLVSCIFALLKWVKDEFNIIPAVLVYALVFFNQWIIVSARNLYWEIWLLILPMLLLLFYLKWEEANGKENFKIIMIAEFMAIFIKSACGYEFISLVMINMQLPLFYYMIKNRWNIKKVAKRFLDLSIVAILSFGTAVIICLIQVYFYSGKSWGAAVNSLTSRIAYRTGLGNTEAFSGVIQESLKASKISVIETYFSEGYPLLFQFRMDRLIIWILVGVALTFASATISRRIASKRKELMALNMMTLISFLGPLSWYILASGHSYVHPHINYILWSTPFLILGGIIFFTTISSLLIDTIIKLKKYLLILLSLLAIVVVYFYFDYYSYALEIKKMIFTEGEILFTNNIVTVYLYDDDIYYLTTRNNDNRKRYYLHFITSDTEASNMLTWDFVNNDFNFKECELKLPFWSNVKMATIQMPNNYAVDVIETGQFENNVRFWEAKIDIFDKMDDLTRFTICNLTDDNWNHGFNKVANIILVESNDVSFEYLGGKAIQLSDGSKRIITDVVREGKYYHIYTNEYTMVQSDYVTAQILK